MATPGTQEWLDQVIEDVIDPDLEIIDPHHHLWPAGQGLPYQRDDLHRDVNGHVGRGAHKVIKTVFMECGSAYDRSAPEHLRSLGETRYIADQALSDPEPLMAGIVGHVDLRRDDLDDLLDRHTEAGRGLFRGVRDALSRAEHPDAMMIPGRAPRDLYLDPDFRRGVRRLGERGLTYDSWHYHHQNREFLDLARATPGTTMVLDHFGTPIGVGPYASQREEIFARWKTDIADIAALPNTVAKIGGLAMPDNGFRLELRRASAHVGRVPRSAVPVLPARHRMLRARAVHVRVELPRRPAVGVLRRVVERLQEVDRGVLGVRASCALLGHRGACIQGVNEGGTSCRKKQWSRCVWPWTR